MSRESGVLLPLFSLPGGYSVGSAGEAAFRFIDQLAEGGFSLWQVLPFCLPGEGDSPYKSYSAFSYNYAFVDLPELFSRGLLTQGELAEAREHTPYLCEYERVKQERFSLLARAAGRLGDRSQVYSFLENNPGTERFCRFMALRRAKLLGGKVGRLTFNKTSLLITIISSISLAAAIVIFVIIS